MDTMQAISQRRSIRRYKDKPVPDDAIRQILHAATLAPSGKNRQPWRFVVVKAGRRDEMVRVMRQGIEACKEQGIPVGSSPATASIMERAPVTVFVFNPYARSTELEPTRERFLFGMVDIQSVGAAIQNMLLAAYELGLGTLWICDVFYAYDQLCNWLGQDAQLIAAVTIGYPDEAPGARPRRSLEEVVEWW